MKQSATVLNNDNTVFFDVDDTLVLWEYPHEQIDNTIVISAQDGYSVRVLPHLEHIKRLKQFKARAQGVVVWSQGGWEWAQAVVRALDLDEYVDIIMAKPRWLFDDLPVKYFLNESNRTYIDPVTGINTVRKET